MVLTSIASWSFSINSPLVGSWKKYKKTQHINQKVPNHKILGAHHLSL